MDFNFFNRESKTIAMSEKQVAPTLVQNATYVFTEENSSGNDYNWMVGLDLHGQNADYYIESVIAEGGEAIVFLCNSNGNKYVAKYYVNVRRMSSDKRNKFIEVLHNQTCPYIVPLIDYGEYDHKLFDIYPYVENGNLIEHPVALEFIRDVVIPNVNEALRIIHSYNIAHRDIKPQNILISDDGSHVMLNDFSIMSVVEEETGGVHTTTAYRTNGYAAPEILMMTPHKISDYYAFGISLLSLINGGKNLFEDMTEGMIYESTVNSRIPYLNIDKFDNLIPGTLTLKDRIEGLICGLTIYDHKKRWGYEQVQEWCAEIIDYPQIDNERENADFTEPYFGIDGSRIYTLQGLAEYLGENWEQAKIDIPAGVITSWLSVHRPDVASNINNVISNNEWDTEDNKDSGVFKVIYTISSDLPALYWRGERFSDFSALAIRISHKNNFIHSLLRNRLLTWFISNNSAINSYEANLCDSLHQLESLSFAKPIQAEMVFMYQFLPHDEERYFEIEGHSISNVDELLDLVVSNNISIKNKILLNYKFEAWMIFYGCGSVYSSAVEGINDATEEECYKRMLTILDVIHPDKERVRNHIILKSDFSHILWVKEHLDEYDYINSHARDIRNKFLNLFISTSMSARDLYEILGKAKNLYIDFCCNLYNEPFSIVQGIARKNAKGIIPKKASAAFMYEKENVTFPAGYVKANSISDVINLYYDAGKRAEKDHREVKRNLLKEIDLVETELYQQKTNFYSGNIFRICIYMIYAIAMLIASIELNNKFFVFFGVVSMIYPIGRIIREIYNAKNSDYIYRLFNKINLEKAYISSMEEYGNNVTQMLNAYYDGNGIDVELNSQELFSYRDYEKRLNEQFSFIQKTQVPKSEHILFAISGYAVGFIVLGYLNQYFVQDLLIKITGEDYDYSGFVYCGGIISVMAGVTYSFFRVQKKMKITLKDVINVFLFALAGVGALILGVGAVMLIAWLVEVILGILASIIMLVVIVGIIIAALSGS